MIGLIMAGGKGTRMQTANEKLLLKYIHPTILHVVFAMQNSDCFSRIFAATSKNSPKTKEMLQNAGIEVKETSGNGYVEDLNSILHSLNDDVFVTSGDLPLLDSEIIKKIVSTHNTNKIWSSILVTKKFLTSLGLNPENSIIFQNQECHYTGISIIDSREINDLNFVEEIYQIIDDKRIAFNLNTKEDYKLLDTS